MNQSLPLMQMRRFKWKRGKTVAKLPPAMLLNFLALPFLRGQFALWKIL